MKRILRFFLWVLGVAAGTALLLGAVLGVAWLQTSVPTAPTVSATLAGEKLQRTGFAWQQPVLFGVLHKKLSEQNYASQRIGLDGFALPLALEKAPGVTAEIEVLQGGKSIYRGDDTAAGNFYFPAAGEYVVQVHFTQPPRTGEAFGTLTYSATVDVKAALSVVLSAEKIPQGGVVGVRVLGVPAGATPQGTSPVGQVAFSLVNGIWKGAIPISYSREPGSYTLQVTAGGLSVQKNFAVQGGSFPALSRPAAKAVSAGDLAAYRQNVWPLFATADPKPYTGPRFLFPVAGDIVVGYGASIQHEGQKGVLRHPGIDIASPEDAPLICPADGRVVYVGAMAVTGNLVVVEHGLGLKTYYYYLKTVSVKKGDVLKAGQLLGTTGKTGIWDDDTDASHLQFEVRIGNQAIDPAPLLDGTSGLFF